MSKVLVVAIPESSLGERLLAGAPRIERTLWTDERTNA
jgi:hypothetical protein